MNRGVFLLSSPTKDSAPTFKPDFVKEIQKIRKGEFRKLKRLDGLAR